MYVSCVKVPKSDEEYDLRVPRDMAYIFSGAYVPLSCKLIEQVRVKAAALSYSTGSVQLTLLSLAPAVCCTGVGARWLDGTRRSRQALKWKRICCFRLDCDCEWMKLRLFSEKSEIQMFCLSGNNGADLGAKNDAQRTILVMFLGGCTYSEISALRFLGRERGEYLMLREKNYDFF